MYLLTKFKVIKKSNQHCVEWDEEEEVVVVVFVYSRVVFVVKSSGDEYKNWGKIDKKIEETVRK